MSSNSSDVEALLQDVVKLSTQRGRRNPGTILLVGKVGSGKSSMVNTIIKALLGEAKDHLPKAKAGGGATSSETLSLNLYANCGLNENDIGGSCNEDMLRECHRHLPNIIDMAGQDDQDSPALREILKLLLAGYIPKDTTIGSIEEHQAFYGVGKLHEVYRADPQLKVTHIVFVQNGKERPPQNLIQCIRAVTRATHAETGKLIYAGELFIVITGLDLHEEQSSEEDNSTSSTTQITASTESTPEEYTDIYSKNQLEKDIRKAFAIEGVSKHNMLWWTNYCDKVGYDTDLSIDAVVLKFLKRMVLLKTKEEVIQIPPWRRSWNAILEQPADIAVIWREVCFLRRLLFRTLLAWINQLAHSEYLTYLFVVVLVIVAMLVGSLFVKKPESPSLDKGNDYSG